MARTRRSRPAPQDDFFPGYADVDEIGVGSLATVYRAREVATNRLVALKLLNVDDASPRALESFERESIALGAVSSHPNIVTLHRSFRAVDERPVLVLELCHGSVGDRMRGGAGLAVAEVVALGIKIAGALETAHRAAILSYLARRTRDSVSAADLLADVFLVAGVAAKRFRSSTNNARGFSRSRATLC